MGLMNLLYLEEFGKAFVPKKIRPKLSRYLAKAGIDDVPYKFFGALFWLTALITYFIYIPGVYPVIRQKSIVFFFAATFISWFLIQITLLLIIMLAISFYLNIMIYKRTKILEDMLPDYLSLVSTNLKGGMNLEKALWAAIKPEFGILSKEIGVVSKKVATGNDVTEALEEFSEKYQSPLLRRSVDLLKGEIVSGGSISQVIDSIVENLKRTKQLKEEMVATTLTYMIFMAAIVIVITPALFALSEQILVIILRMGARLSASFQATTVSSMFKFSAANVDVDQFKIFSVVAISIISVFTSMIISTIEKGDIKGGIKYIPLFLVSSVVLYFIFVEILGALLGSLVVV